MNITHTLREHQNNTSNSFPYKLKVPKVRLVIIYYYIPIFKIKV